jgi:hypothetical protein
MKPPDVKDTYLGLVGAAISFMNLYDNFRDEVFLNAAAAAAQLGLSMRGLPESTVVILSKE